LNKKRVLTRLAVILTLGGLVLARLDAGDASKKRTSEDPPAALAALQFLPDELAQRARFEEFLKTAEVVGSKQLVGSEAVTSPWVLTLKLGDVTHRGLWKNAQGRMGGYWEGWTYEIAAYLLDKHLGIGLVPPTVERRFHDERGSCQYWVDDCLSLRDREQKKIKMPPAKVMGWNRATYLQRLFDNLIANEDRHMNQILITPDWRMVLIDHSRSFRTSGRFTKSLLYSAKNPEGPKLMSQLPRTVVDKVKSLDFGVVKAVVGPYLSDEEIRAVLIRRDLILAEIDRLVSANGESQVFY
jgi:hypothetical protein